MHVQCESGLELDIPNHHTVFVPVGDYKDGDVVDPETVDVEPGRAVRTARPGKKIIVDNRVEIIAAVH